MGFPWEGTQETGPCHRPWVVPCAPCPEMQIAPWRSKHSAGYRHHPVWKAGRGECRVFCRLNLPPQSSPQKAKQFPPQCKGPPEHLHAVTEIRHSLSVLVDFTPVPHQSASQNALCPSDRVAVSADGILAGGRQLVELHRMSTRPTTRVLRTSS